MSDRAFMSKPNTAREPFESIKEFESKKRAQSARFPPGYLANENPNESGSLFDPVVIIESNSIEASKNDLNPIENTELQAVLSLQLKELEGSDFSDDEANLKQEKQFTNRSIGFKSESVKSSRTATNEEKITTSRTLNAQEPPKSVRNLQEDLKSSRNTQEAIKSSRNNKQVETLRSSRNPPNLEEPQEAQPLKSNRIQNEQNAPIISSRKTGNETYRKNQSEN